MKPVRVLIGTTEGPIRVLRITEEDASVKSVICLHGKAGQPPLPISRQYEAFVRQPTGVVQWQFGHAAYRMDVDGAIDEGHSWQLGAFLAHALAAEGALAGKDETAAAVIWLTGEVDRELSVLAVEEVPRKLDRSRSRFDEIRAAGRPITVVVPRPNLAEAAAWAATNGYTAEAMRLVGVDGVGQALAVAGLRLPRPSAGSGRRAPWRRAWPYVFAAVGLVGLVLGLVVMTTASSFAYWQYLADAGKLRELDGALAQARGGDACWSCAVAAGMFERRLEAARPDPAALRLDVLEVRPRSGATCPPPAEAQKDDYQTRPAGRDAAGDFAASRAEGLCGLEFMLSNDGQPVYVWIFAQAVPSLDFLLSTPRALAERTEPVKDAIAVAVRVPPLSEPLRYRIIALASRYPVAEAANWALSRVAKGATPPTGWREVSAHLERRGITVLSAWHLLLPPAKPAPAQANKAKPGEAKPNDKEPVTRTE